MKTKKFSPEKLPNEGGLAKDHCFSGFFLLPSLTEAVLLASQMIVVMQILSLYLLLLFISSVPISPFHAAEPQFIANLINTTQFASLNEIITVTNFN